MVLSAFLLMRNTGWILSCKQIPVKKCGNIKLGRDKMDRLAAFEKMLSDIQKQSEYEKEQMDTMKAAGKEKTATYRQYLGNRMLYKMMMEKYREYGLAE